MKTKQWNQSMETALRDLDAALSPATSAQDDARASALYARIMDSPTSGNRQDGLAATASASSPGDRPKVRSPFARRALMGGVAAAALAAGSVLVPNLFGASPALAWSAVPQRLTADQAREAQEACEASVSSTEASMSGVDLSGIRPVVTELRGSLVLVYGTDSKPAPSDITCYVRDGKVVASGGGAATEHTKPLPPLPGNSLHGYLGGVYSTPSGSIRGVTGQVGSDVVGVVLDSVAQGPVTATVNEGHFAAWWPDAPTSEEQENAATAPEITGATVTLRDGTSRQVSVEELSGRTAEELGRPDTGGSSTTG